MWEWRTLDRFSGVAKYTAIIPLSVLISCKLSLPVVDLQVSSAPAFALRSSNEGINQIHTVVPHRSCPLYHSLLLLLVPSAAYQLTLLPGAWLCGGDICGEYCLIRHICQIIGCGDIQLAQAMACCTFYFQKQQYIIHVRKGMIPMWTTGSNEAGSTLLHYCWSTLNVVHWWQFHDIQSFGRRVVAISVKWMEVVCWKSCLKIQSMSSSTAATLWCDIWIDMLAVERKTHDLWQLKQVVEEPCYTTLWRQTAAREVLSKSRRHKLPFKEDSGVKPLVPPTKIAMQTSVKEMNCIGNSAQIHDGSRRCKAAFPLTDGDTELVLNSGV